MPDIRSIVNDSLFSEQSLFVLSAGSNKGRNRVQDLLLKTWQQVQQDSTTPHVRDLALVRLSFPWSEHPAHALYTSIIELRDLDAWETIVGQAFPPRYDHDPHPVATNAQIATVLECIAHPGRLGTHDYLHKHPIGQYGALTAPLFRAYLLDMEASASDRSKLGLARALTTQDRYELLRCLWRCEQGLAPDPDVREHTRLWVYLDEAEHVLDYAPAERKLLVKGLTHLIAHTDEFLTFWVNIAVPDQETIQAVKRAFGASLLKLLDGDFTADGEPTIDQE